MKKILSLIITLSICWQAISAQTLQPSPTGAPVVTPTATLAPQGPISAVSCGCTCTKSGGNKVQCSRSKPCSTTCSECSTQHNATSCSCKCNDNSTCSC